MKMKVHSSVSKRFKKKKFILQRKCCNTVHFRLNKSKKRLTKLSKNFIIIGLSLYKNLI